jgi:hypothetical protein
VKPVKTVFYTAALLPYAAVAAGLYLFHSAWVAMLAYHIGIVLALVLARHNPLEAKSRFTLTNGLFPLTLAACLLAGPVVAWLWPWLSAADLAARLSAWGLTARAWPWFVAYFCLANPFLEEAYWRSWLDQADRPGLEPAAWFAGYHLIVLAPILRAGWLVTAFLIMTLTGWVWSRLSRRDGFRPVALCHLAADASIMLAAGFCLLQGWGG